MKFTVPFPAGELNPFLRDFGFVEEDILEIRKILLKEIKRQNEKVQELRKTNKI